MNVGLKTGKFMGNVIRIPLSILFRQVIDSPNLGREMEVYIMVSQKDTGLAGTGH